MSPDCGLCPRLAAYRADNRRLEGAWHNAPALPFGEADARLLIVGLAPGRTGANRTGRVFTGDTAGGFLFEALLRVGMAEGTYRDDGDDDLSLRDCRVTNAVLCAPPSNKPTPLEQATCRPFLTDLIAAMPRLKVILTLGDVARRNVLKALGTGAKTMTAGHGALASVAGYTVNNSYHCSRLNLNTGRLTAEMFDAILAKALDRISEPAENG